MIGATARRGNKRADTNQRVAAVLLEDQWSTVIVAARSLCSEIGSKRAQSVRVGYRRSIELNAIDEVNDTSTRILQRD